MKRFFLFSTAVLLGTCFATQTNVATAGTFDDLEKALGQTSPKFAIMLAQDIEATRQKKLIELERQKKEAVHYWRELRDIVWHC